MESLHFNIRYNEQKKSLSSPQCEQPSYVWLLERTEELFIERPRSWALIYVDDEDEAVTISCDDELREACRIALCSPDCKTNGLDLFIMPKLTFKDYLEDLSSSISKFAASAKEKTMHSTSHYAGLGRETLFSSAAQTKSVFNNTRQELTVRISRVQQFVREQRWRLPSRGSNADSPTHKNKGSPFDDPILRKYPVFPNANDIEKVILPNQASGCLHKMKTPKVVSKSIESNESSRSQTRDTSSDVDTDGESDEERERSESTNLSPDALARRELHRRWRTQTAIVQNIVPQVDIDNVCRLLSTHNGDVDAVMLSLTE